jgi:hypothetical protein
MRAFLRLTTLVASFLVTVWALPGCSSNEGAGGKMDSGAMKGGEMSGPMDKGKMNGGAMEGDKMSGPMDKGKTDGGAMEKGKMDAASK